MFETCWCGAYRVLVATLLGTALFAGCTEPNARQFGAKFAATDKQSVEQLDSKVVPSDIESSPDEIAATKALNRGMENMDANCPDTALLDFSEAIAKRPDAEGYFQRARAHFALGQLGHTIRDCTDSLHENPRVAKVHQLRGQAYLLRKDFERATSDLRLATEIEPNLTAELAQVRAEAHSGLAGLLEEQDRREEAAEQRRLADECWPEGATTRTLDNVSAEANEYYHEGDRLFQVEDYSSAIAQFSKAIAIEPRWGRVFVARAKAFLEYGDPRSAEADVYRAMTVSKATPEAYFMLAKAKSLSGNSIGAIRSATEVLRQEPEMLDAYVLRATAYLKQNSWALAAIDFEKAGQLNTERVAEFSELLAKAASDEVLKQVDEDVILMRRNDPVLASRVERIAANTRATQNSQAMADTRPTLNLEDPQPRTLLRPEIKEETDTNQTPDTDESASSHSCEPTVTRRVVALRCLYCGRLNEENADYCQGCGRRLSPGSRIVNVQGR